MRLKRDDRTISEYVSKFDELAKYAPLLVATSEARKHRFLSELDHYTRDKLVGFKHENISTLVSMTLEYEQNYDKSRSSKKAKLAESSHSGEGKGKAKVEPPPPSRA